MRDDPFTNLARGKDCNADRNYAIITLCTSRIFRTPRFESLGGEVHDEETSCFWLAFNESGLLGTREGSLPETHRSFKTRCL